LRKQNRIRSLAAVLLLIIGTACFAVVGYRVAGIHWSYIVGEEMRFRLQVLGYRDIYEIPYLDHNSTVLTANITSLPDPYLVLTRDGFVQLMNSIKTSTYLANGSYAPSELNLLISRSIIPLGAYDMIDSHFLDTAADRGVHDCYVSSISGSLLNYGHTYAFVDVGEGWDCFLNTTTGYPVYMEIWRWEWLPYASEDYRIVLTLVS